MQISFPREQQLTFENGGVDFPAIVDGRRVPCMISREALDDHFKGRPFRRLRSFRCGFPHIRAGRLLRCDSSLLYLGHTTFNPEIANPFVH